MKKVLRFLLVLTILLGTGGALVAVALPAGSVFAQTIGRCTDNNRPCILRYCQANPQECLQLCKANEAKCSSFVKDLGIDPSLLGLTPAQVAGSTSAQTQTTGGLLEDCPCDPDLGLTCKNGICIAELPAGPQSGGEILRIIDAIGDWIFAAFMLLAVIFIILALFDFITGGGDPAKISSARQKLIYAVIGVGLALVAGGIDNVLQNILLP